MKNIINLFCILSLTLFFGNAYSQHIPYIDSTGTADWTLADKINKSDALIEGRVIKTDGFLLDPKSKRVFTSITIRVSRIFKGDIKDSVIELITDGGTFPSGENKGVKTTSQWGMRYEGEEGLFFLRKNSSTIQSRKNIQSYFYLYGKSVLLYSHSEPYYPITHDGAKRYDDLGKELYPDIQSITGTPAKVTGLNSFEAAKKK